MRWLVLDFMGQRYRKRWSIESCFQNLKEQGFDIKSTHLKSFDKIKKFLVFVSIIYAFV
jgi:transposase